MSRHDRNPAFVIPALMMLTVVFTATGAGIVLLSPSPEGEAMTIAVEAVPAAGAGISWSARATEATAAQDAGLRRLIGTTRAFVGLTGLVALLGLVGLWQRESLARRAERALRRAVGASRRRLRKEAVVETTALAAVAGAFGALATVLVATGAAATWPGPVPGSVERSAPRVLVVVLLAGGLGTLLRGLAFSAATATGALLDAERSLVEAMDRREAYPLLSVTQIALVAAVLTAGVSLLTAITPAAGDPDVAIDAAEPGPEDLYRVEVSRTTSVDRASTAGLAALLERTREVPGTGLAGFASPGATVALGRTDFVLAQCGRCFAGGLPLPIKGQRTVHHLATPDTFDALGLAVVAGRGFRPSDDRTAGPVAVVSRSFARENFENGDPLGRGLRVGAGLDAWYTVVGVVEDAGRWAVGAREQPMGEVYLSALQHDVERGELLVAGVADPGTIAAAARSAGWTAGSPEPLARHVQGHRAQLSWFARVWTGLSAVALALAVYGVFSSIRLKTHQELREIGIRRAVGARRVRVLLRYLGAGLKLGGSGLGIGLWLSLFALPHLPTLPAPDARLAALLCAAVVVPLIAAAVAGSIVPAWRAARLTPTEAMGEAP